MAKGKNEELRRADFVRAVSRRTSIPAGQVRPMVEVFFETIKGALQAGRRVEFRGFGSFFARGYGATFMRNPRTGEAVVVGPRRKVVFKPSRLLLGRIAKRATSSEAEPSVHTDKHYDG
ncbi:MAG: integration host factor subunit beta [Candidatus Coatesbacteria bacterium]|nr:MAG: integration host factor subunit beta [Candidatus Coatesbacteria bacterium]